MSVGHHINPLTRYGVVFVRINFTIAYSNRKEILLEKIAVLTADYFYGWPESLIFILIYFWPTTYAIRHKLHYKSEYARVNCLSDRLFPGLMFV